MAEKEKRINELENQAILIEHQNENTIDRLNKELEEYKEQVLDLKRSEVLVEIYKKQVDQMADLRCELNISQEENQKLYSSMEVLQHEVEKTTMLEEMVSRVQHELR